MKRTVLFGSHLLASVFLFYLMGYSITLLLMRSKWLDMRFDSEFFITIAMIAGIWFYFVMLFMEGKQFALWTRKKINVIILITAAFFTILFTVVLNQGIAIIPAYMTRKAWFLTDIVSLQTMNIILLFWVVLGCFSLFYASKEPLSLKKGTTMLWNNFSTLKRFAIMSLFIMIEIIVLLYLGQGEFQSILDQAIIMMKNADIEGFRAYLLSFGPLAAIISGLLMVFQSVIAPLPAFVITFTNGLLFGWFFGTILSWTSAMLGAVVCFYLAKFLGRPVVEKIVSKKGLDWWDQFFDHYGKYAIFIARLVPIVSFDLVSYAAGVTSIPFWQFFWATGLGQLPATILYSYLGENATDTVQILFFMFTIVIALAVIAMLLKPKFSTFKKK